MFAAASPLSLRLFGPLAIERDGQALALPASRKTRAILGYLALAPRPVGRQRLCELFFELPDDPRASLRWSLTKLRPLLDEAARPRLVAERDTLRLETQGLPVDANEVMQLAAAADGLPSPEQCRRAIELMAGPLLEDCDLPDRPEYSAWLASQRQDFRGIALRLSARLAELTSGEERIAHLHRMVALDPYDESALAALVRDLSQGGRRQEARDLVANAERRLERAGLPVGPALRLALRHAPIVVPPTAQSTPPPQIMCAPAPRTDGRPIVAILPLVNHCPGDCPESLVEGLLEAALHMLSKFRRFKVLPLARVLPFSGNSLRPEDLARELGADYLVGGSVLTHHGGAFKLRYRLVRASDAAILTSGDVDHPSSDAIALLEDVPARLVALLAHHLGSAARARALDVPQAERSADDHLHVGIHHGFFANPLDYRAALADFEAGLALAPGDAVLNAYHAWARGLLGLAVSEPLRGSTLRQCHRAMSDDDPDSDALAMAAWAAVHIGRDFEPALHAVELATRLNPLSRIAWSASAWVRAMAGEVELPLQHWDNAERCNPLGANIDTTHCGRALCCWMAARYEAAEIWAKRGLDWQPGHPAGHMAATASAMELADYGRATARAHELLRYFPLGVETPAIATVPIRDPAVKKRLLSTIQNAIALARGDERSGIEQVPAESPAILGTYGIGETGQPA